MDRPNSYLHGISYVLGENKRNFDSAEGFTETISESKMPNFPELWGWGFYYQTDNIYELAIESAKKTLTNSSISPADIDLVIFSSVCFPEAPSRLYPVIGKIVAALGCANALIKGHTLDGCAAVLNAIYDAQTIISTKKHQNILVIGLANMPPEAKRFTDFALFGDACCSCIVSSTPGNNSLEIVDLVQKIDLNEVCNGVGLNPDNNLSKNTLNLLLDRNSISISNIDKLINNNIFLPLKKLNESRLGLKAAQIFNENIARIGHCHACDGIINLTDYISSTKTPNGNIVIQSDGNGHCVSMLIR